MPHSKRDVSAANFSLHEAHCMRFLAICPECNEPIALKEMEKHQEEEHKQVRVFATVLTGKYTILCSIALSRDGPEV
uniref:Uncharacterized protein n=1 Tax=Chelonoidis abingdonii TaxID=106734 RepID=A0A8C0H2R4_CHEAB